jgi:hypothetical protein
MLALKLNRHAAQLRAAYCVRIRYNPLLVGNALAYRNYRMIEMPFPIIGERSYATFMHEMGHIMDHNQKWCYPNGPSNIILTDEIAAWNWAKEHAICWTAKMENLRNWALSTWYVSLWGA